MKNLNSFLNNPEPPKSTHKSPIKRKNDSPVIPQSSPKKSSEIPSTITSESQTSNFKIVDKTPPRDDVRELNDDEINSLKVDYNSFQWPSFNNFFTSENTSTSNNTDSSDLQSRLNNIRKLLFTPDQTLTNPEVQNESPSVKPKKKFTRKTTKITDEDSIKPIQKTNENLTILDKNFNSNSSEHRYNLRNKFKSISSQTEDHFFINEINEQNNKIKTLEILIQQQKDNISELSSENKRVCDRNISLTNELKQKTVPIDTNSEIQSLRNKCINYEKTLEEIAKHAQIMNNNYNDLLKKTESLNEKIISLKNEEQSLNSSLKKERENSQYFSKELAKANSKIEELVEEINHSRVELINLHKNSETIINPNSELQSKYEEASRLLSHLQLEYRHLEDINKALTLENQKTPSKSPTYSVRSTNSRINSGIQSEATDESSTEEPNHSGNSHTKKFSKSKKKVRNQTTTKSTNNTSELPHNINNPNPEDKIVTSTPLRPQTPENTIPKRTAYPQNNNILGG